MSALASNSRCPSSRRSGASPSRTARSSATPAGSRGSMLAVAYNAPGCLSCAGSRGDSSRAAACDRWAAFDQAVEQRLGLAVEPVQVFEHQRLALVSRTSSALMPSRVRRRRWGGSSACHAESSTGRSSRASSAGRIGFSASSSSSTLPSTFSALRPRSSAASGRNSPISTAGPQELARPDDTEVLQHQPGADPTGARELVEQPRLADARTSRGRRSGCMAAASSRPIERRQAVARRTARRPGRRTAGREPALPDSTRSYLDGRRCP